MSTVWDEVKNQVKSILPGKSYSLWINPLSLIEEKDDTLVLGCPNKFSMNWITEHYRKTMEEKLQNMGRQYNLVFKVSSPKKKSPEPDIFKKPFQCGV
jgi:chromosomal replication initiator protein